MRIQRNGLITRWYRIAFLLQRDDVPVERDTCEFFRGLGTMTTLWAALGCFAFGVAITLGTTSLQLFEPAWWVYDVRWTPIGRFMQLEAMLVCWAVGAALVILVFGVSTIEDRLARKYTFASIRARFCRPVEIV